LKPPSNHDLHALRVILTHEQADFDALGSLLGAWLLDESAIPVLPHRINRNGRAFLTLYGHELPFVEARDMPAGSIGHILLVDTQSLVTLRGLGHHTRIDVLDHHKKREGLSPEWQVKTDHTGACTTLMVEGMQERGMPLTVVQATLLLLGIYEDTSSLTYINTTARDARAAAYLLEQGASLTLLGRFLNPPLSPEQRALYDELMGTIETVSLHGLKIMIATAASAENTSEVSSVAHKLRDQYDPHALFLVVATSEGIRIVARSHTDQINVAAVMGHFGGGGHEWAAAALLPPNATPSAERLQQVRQRLIGLLPGIVRPSITVAQMMSRKPHVLPPRTPVAEAAAMMQRYGYEGFPVVDENKQVVGLLTRRAVDRAMSHKLNLPAASLMEAGCVTVGPDDSIEHLQQVMTNSGWGQVPVVDPVSGEITGIVTRTDLLKTLTLPPNRLQRENLGERLEAALPPAHLALLKTIAALARARRTPVYVVGGFVRDLLLERPTLDFDVVAEGDAIGLARALSDQFGGRVVAHSRFGTAKWFTGEVRGNLAAALGGGELLNPADLPESLDLIAARTEFYDYPTALPTVERSGIKLDLHRRDFTINTLAIRLDGRHYGELYDYWNGENDIRHGLVRVLHSLSFIDDPTRLLRAVRFEQRFNFRIENRTLQLMDEALPMLKQVSGQRIQHELNLMMAEPRVLAMLTRLARLNILPAIHPDLPWDERIAARLHQNHAEEWNWPLQGGIPSRETLFYLLWLGGLPLARITSIAERLRLSSAQLRALTAASALLADLSGLKGAPPSAVVERLDELPPAAIYAAACLAEDESLRQPLLAYQQTWQYVHPRTDGETLQARGLPPSPLYRVVLKTLRGAWLDGRISSAEEETALLDDLLTRLDPAEYEVHRRK